MNTILNIVSTGMSRYSLNVDKWTQLDVNDPE
jgi:hypothetical protein